MNLLTLWLPQDLSSPWPWHDGNRFGIAVSAAEKALLGASGAKDSLAIIPGQWVRIFAHDFSKMRVRERMSAAKFSIEDKLAAPLETQHCVIGADTDQRIAVISQEKIQAIVAALHDAGLGRARVCADFDALQNHDQALRLADRIIVPGAVGYSVDPDMAGLTDIGSAPHASLDQISAFIDVEKALNLRAGVYAVKGQGFGQFDLRSFSRVAILLAVLGVSYGLWEASKIRAGQAAIADLKSQSRALYAQATGKPAPPNPARAVTRALRSGQTQNADFLALSSALFKAMESVDGVMIDSLQFDASRGQLNLRLIYPSFESATALEQAAAQYGVVFKPGGVREQGGQRIGDAVLRGGS